jgi:3-phenylpropionate/trans-cinnamate dioxygenase ferredoxin subunit
MVFVKIAETTEVPAGAMKSFTLGENEVLVLNVNGKYYAMNNKCPHMGGDLSKGTLQGIVLTCPRHSSRFDVTNGNALSGPKFGPIKLKVSDARVYPAQVDGTAIMVDVG